MEKLRISQYCQFSGNEFFNSIGCLILYPNSGIGGLRLWEKEEAQNISVKKSNIRYIIITYLYNYPDKFSNVAIHLVAHPLLLSKFFGSVN